MFLTESYLRTYNIEYKLFNCSKFRKAEEFKCHLSHR